jgi:hypothetical protein
MRIGGLGFTGLIWSDLLRSRAAANEQKPRDPKSGGFHFGKAKACIIIFNYGGPSHLDIWDLKPDAPQEIRGEFKPIATRVPGISITEHLPKLAKLADHFSIIRSVNHRDNDHAIGTYLAFTGYSHPKHEILGIEPPATPQDLPALGSVISKLRPSRKPVFSYVTLGDLRHFGNHDSMGQIAGCLGKAYDPFSVPFVRPLNGSLDVQGVTSVMQNTDAHLWQDRKNLLEQFNQLAPALEKSASMRTLDDSERRAYELLSSSATRNAFNVSSESPKTIDHYGSSRFAQNCLLARRLVEAGVPMVTLNSVGNRDWDTHGNNFKELKDTLLPPMDRGVSALLEDLSTRGMLDETLVIWMGDMGRTPRMNKGAGRDHWSFCYSVMMAGGGIRGGQVLGSSDRAAAYPSTYPISPGDIATTVYHCLGIDPQTHVTDQQGRPLVIGNGTPIYSLLS